VTTKLTAATAAIPFAAPSAIWRVRFDWVCGRASKRSATCWRSRVARAASIGDPFERDSTRGSIYRCSSPSARVWSGADARRGKCRTRAMGAALCVAAAPLSPIPSMGVSHNCHPLGLCKPQYRAAKRLWSQAALQGLSLSD